MKLNKTIAVIGAGKIGQTILGGLLDAGVATPKQLYAVTAHPNTLESVRKRFPVRTTLQGVEAARAADIIILCVKPQNVGEVLREIREGIDRKKLVISTVASTPLAFFEDELGEAIPVIRTMPNTPCLIRQGMTVISPGRFAKNPHVETARRIFDTLGRSLVLDEKHMDAVTGLSGSGPAFMYMVIEALAEGGVKVGLPREVATTLAAQTMLGAGKMVVERGAHPALLKDEVTTPAGCTIDGILELEEGALRVTLIKAVVRATARAGELFPSDGRKS